MTDLTDAKVIAHSSWDGVEIVSFHLTFPRIILAEFNTHRAFSRNSASSRAIPLSKTIAAVRENPFVPQQWPKNQAGMSAKFSIRGERHADADLNWRYAIEDALKWAEGMADIGVHKQIANRLLEPFMWHTVIMTTTMPGLNNFFELRDHPDAQWEIQILARKMKEALETNRPKERPVHIPFSKFEHHHTGIWTGDRSLVEQEMIRSVARCARVSYHREMEEKTYEEDRALVKKLISSGHYSPLEHMSVADKSHAPLGNFAWPWQQLRHRWPEYLPALAAEINAES